MKVLVVSSLYTHPHNQGILQGLYRNCCQMKRLGWGVDFLFWGNRLLADINAMEDFFGKEHMYYAYMPSKTPQGEIKNYIRTKMKRNGMEKYIPILYTTDELYCKEVEEKVHFLNNKNNYDIVWLDFYFQSKIFENLPKNILSVIYTHDSFGNRHKLYLKKGRVPEYYYMTLKSERVALARADVVVAVQDKEREYFEKLLKGTKTKSITISNLVELKDKYVVTEKVYGFMGHDNDCNMVAVKWFIENMLPKIREQEPNSRFILAGAICQHIPDGEGYEKLGFVDSIEEFYRQVMFVVTPLKDGTGINIKNIEALAYQKPVITTTIGSRGMELANGALIVVDTEEEIVESVINLLRSPDVREKMSESAKEFIEGFIERNNNSLQNMEKYAAEKKKQTSN